MIHLWMAAVLMGVANREWSGSGCIVGIVRHINGSSRFAQCHGQVKAEHSHKAPLVALPPLSR
jgi:hypothetical protein